MSRVAPLFFAHVVVVGVKSNWSLYVHAVCRVDVAVADEPSPPIVTAGADEYP